jgi:hypothetical protein
MTRRRHLRLVDDWTPSCARRCRFSSGQFGYWRETVAMMTVRPSGEILVTLAMAGRHPIRGADRATDSVTDRRYLYFALGRSFFLSDIAAAMQARSSRCNEPPQTAAPPRELRREVATLRAERQISKTH